MKKIICSSCGKKIDSLNELVTCSTGLFKVQAFHEVCFKQKEKRNNLTIYKPNGERILHLASILFTIFVTAIMIIFRELSFITVFSLIGILFLDIYIYLSFSKIERFLKK